MEIIDLDKEALEIARGHLLQNVSYRELAKKYYASPATIHRRLTKWLMENRFDLSDKLEGKTAAFIRAREDGLGEILTRKTGIWRARVVRISGVEPAYTLQAPGKVDSESIRAIYKASDELHRCLGEIAAELILNSLRKNMNIGISSGRGAGFAIEKINEIVKRTPSWVSRYESIRLVSLCGGAHVGMWEFTNSRDFDADENVFALSTILKTPRRNISYMTGPISVEDKRLQSRVNLKSDLNLAIIGLGQLNTQHPYFRDRDALQLKAMSDPIRKLIEWQTHNPDILDGVAEIVLRLYPSGKKCLTPEINDIINETNRSVLAVSPEKIKNAGEILLIAGGKQKVDALYGILTGEYPQAPIDKKNLTLITDVWTAETIIQRISQRETKKNG